MKKITLAAAVAVAAMLSAPMSAHAQNWYAGGAYTNFDADGADVDAVTGRLGFRFNQNFAVEGEASTGIGDDDGVDLNHNAGLYAVGIVPLGDRFDLHGRVGYQTTEVGTPIGDVSDDGLGYGVGATWRVTPAVGIRADWTRIEGEDEAEADALSVGAQFAF